MEYNPESFVEKKTPEIGDKKKAKVVEIKQGKLGELLERDVLERWKDADPEEQAIEVTAELENGMTRKKTITLPMGQEVHPKSNLGKWKKVYGDYPKVDQEIFLIADADGFYQFQI
jgi:hypothetical protein